MKRDNQRTRGERAEPETLTETLRRVLRETGPDGKTNAEAVVEAMIGGAKGGQLEAISTVLRRAGARIKVVVEF